jgi:hypothetical protein
MLEACRSPLQRLIRAGAGIAGQNASVGSVHGKASRCYQVNARIKPDSTITGTTSASRRRPGRALASRRDHHSEGRSHGHAHADAAQRQARRRLPAEPLGC